MPRGQWSRMANELKGESVECIQECRGLKESCVVSSPWSPIEGITSSAVVMKGINFSVAFDRLIQHAMGFGLQGCLEFSALRYDKID